MANSTMPPHGNEYDPHSLNNSEKHAAQQFSPTQKGIEDGSSSDVDEAEQTPKEANELNYSDSKSKPKTAGKNTLPAGKLGVAMKVLELRKKGPLGIIALIIIGFLSFSGLFSNSGLLLAINGMLANKINPTAYVEKILEKNGLRLSLFGGKSNIAIGDCTLTIVCRAKGLSDEQIKAFEKKGYIMDYGNSVKKGDGRTVLVGMTSPDGVRIDEKALGSKEFLKDNPVISDDFKVITKSIRSKIAASKWFRGFKELHKIATNGKIKVETTPEGKPSIAKAMNDQVTGSSNDFSVKPGDTTPPENETEEQKKARVEAEAASAKITEGANDAIADQKSEIEEGKKRASAGTTPSTGVIPSVEDLVTAEIGEDGIVGVKSSTAQKIGAFLNPLDIVNTSCAVYSFGQIAYTTAKIIALQQFVSYGMSFITMAQKVMAGEGDAAQNEAFSNILMQQNSNGQTFEDSAMMDFLINGDLSKGALPPIVNAAGGSLMMILGTALKTTQAVFGGKTTIRTVCNLAGNLAIQGVALVASFLTGGAGSVIAGATKLGVKEGIKLIVKKAKDAVIAKIKENITDKTIKEITIDVLKKPGQATAAGFKKVGQAIKAGTKEILESIKPTSVGGVVNALGISTAIAQAFAMQSIANTLSGENIASIMNNSVASGEAIYTAYSTTAQSGAMGLGASYLTVPQAVAYNKINDEVIAANNKKSEAEADPFDIHNPYSASGKLLATIHLQTAGVLNTRSITSTLGSLFMMPIVSLGSLFSPKIHAAEKVTQNDINAYVYESSGQEIGTNSVAVDVAGNPLAGWTPSQLQDIENNDLESAILRINNTKESIDTNGSPIADTNYAKYINECINPSRLTLDDNGVMEDQFVRPDYCDNTTEGGNGMTGQEIQNYKTALFYINSSVEDTGEAIAAPNQPDSSLDGSSTGRSGGGPDPVVGRFETEDIYSPSDETKCDPRTQDLGVVSGLSNKAGGRINIRLCSVPTIYQSWSTSNDAKNHAPAAGKANKAIIVNARASTNFYNLGEAAKKDGISLVGSDSFRTTQAQINLQGGGNAITVGESMHEIGYAVDISGISKRDVGNTTVCSNPGNKIWDWLRANAKKYGVDNNMYECWHWTVYPDGKA